MAKLDLKDFTIIIPIRLDSIERLENISTVVRYLKKNLNTNILVIQASQYDNTFLKKCLVRGVKIEFVEDRDNVFYRTKYINKMMNYVQTEYVAIWDADVIVPTGQIVLSSEALRNGADVVYPYDGHFYDTTSIIREMFMKHLSVAFLKRNRSKMGLIYGSNMKGGVFFVRRKKYVESGLENEEFYGWGPEDSERYIRWETLGYQIAQIEGGVFHLTHKRGNDSRYRSNWQKEISLHALETIQNSSKQEIKNQIKRKVNEIV